MEEGCEYQDFENFVVFFKKKVRILIMIIIKHKLIQKLHTSQQLLYSKCTTIPTMNPIQNTKTHIRYCNQYHLTQHIDT